MPHLFTAVIPYFSYAKGDKKDEPRVSIRARVCADAIEAAGVDRVITLDLHAPQVQGFFKVPVDDLYALPILCDVIASKTLPDLVVVAPDAGFAKKARQWSERLNVPLAIADKRRVDHSETAEVVELIGSVAGCNALIVDDFTISAGTLADAARVLIEKGAESVYAAVTHGLLAGEAVNRIDDSPIKRLFMTDSVETQPVALSSKVEVVSVAGLLGEAIRRIANREERFRALHVTDVGRQRASAAQYPSTHCPAIPDYRGGDTSLPRNPLQVGHGSSRTRSWIKRPSLSAPIHSLTTLSSSKCMMSTTHSSTVRPVGGRPHTLLCQSHGMSS